MSFSFISVEGSGLITCCIKKETLSEDEDEENTEPNVDPLQQEKLEDKKNVSDTSRIHTIGRRKTSVARVWMKPGDGRLMRTKYLILYMKTTTVE